MTIQQLQNFRNKLLHAHGLLQKLKSTDSDQWPSVEEIEHSQNALQDILVVLSNMQFEQEKEVRDYVQRMISNWEEGIST
jgi:hypothetical protein